MELASLRLDNLRLFQSLHLELDPGWNLFIGGNGAGKTTVLEAAYLLSHGRSFRSGGREALVREGARSCAIHGELVLGGVRRGLGIARVDGRLEARVAGVAVTVGELMHQAAILCFEPGSSALLTGGAEERRRYLDWGVFHVEHGFLAAWSRCQRALRQRNVLLRQGAGPADLAPWNIELARWGEVLTAMRSRYLQLVDEQARIWLRALLPELGEPRLAFQPGHDAALPLLQELEAAQGRDQERGHTSRGPHRADWTLGFEREASRREHLSRGQQKLGALAMFMGQAEVYRQTQGEMPILCLDDATAEIDAEHLTRVLDLIDRSGSQILATATQDTPAYTALSRPLARFHVEQAQVRRLL